MFVLPHYWCSILFQRAKKSLMSDIENLFIFVSLETDLQISVLQYATSFQNQMQVPEMWFFFVFLRDSWSEWGKKPDVLWWPQQELWVVITRILPPIYHNKAGGGGGVEISSFCAATSAFPHRRMRHRQKMSYACHLTDHISILETQNPSTGWLYVTQKRRSEDFEADEMGYMFGRALGIEGGYGIKLFLK